MSFIPNNLVLVQGQYNKTAVRLFSYKNEDEDDMEAAGFLTDATQQGIRVGDLLYTIGTDLPEYFRVEEISSSNRATLLNLNLYAGRPWTPMDGYSNVGIGLDDSFALQGWIDACKADANGFIQRQGYLPIPRAKKYIATNLLIDRPFIATGALAPIESPIGANQSLLRVAMSGSSAYSLGGYLFLTDMMFTGASPFDTSMPIATGALELQNGGVPLYTVLSFNNVIISRFPGRALAPVTSWSGQLNANVLKLRYCGGKGIEATNCFDWSILGFDVVGSGQRGIAGQQDNVWLNSCRAFHFLDAKAYLPSGTGGNWNISGYFEVKVIASYVDGAGSYNFLLTSTDVRSTLDIGHTQIRWAGVASPGTYSDLAVNNGSVGGTVFADQTTFDTLSGPAHIPGNPKNNIEFIGSGAMDIVGRMKFLAGNLLTTGVCNAPAKVCVA